MIYDNVDTLRKEYKKLLIDNGIKQQFIADRLELSKQQLSNKLNRKQLDFDDMKNLLDIIGYDLIIDFVKREK